MPKELILAVDDEEDILELIKYNLEKEGYRVALALDGSEALNYAREQQPDLVILDLMLPGIDGLDVFKELKNDMRTKNIPVIMLTAKTEDADVVTGLELGADDYITKPFSPRVLLARLKVALRRRKAVEPDNHDVVRVHDILINPARHEVVVADFPIALTASEFRILNFLVRRPGWVFSREQIIRAVKGDDYPVTERSVDVQIVGLRKKLGPAGDYIETVRGVGYRFKE
jgi:two-component system phosphate regulon response regulator PhoB